jgi:hypothetical protein
MKNNYIRDFFNRLKSAGNFGLLGGSFEEVCMHIIDFLYKDKLFSNKESDKELVKNSLPTIHYRLYDLACKCGFETKKKFSSFGAQMFLLKALGNEDFVLSGITNILPKKVCLIVNLEPKLYYDLSYLPLHDFSFIKNEKMNRKEFLIFRRKLGLPKKKYLLLESDFKGLFFVERSEDKPFVDRLVSNRYCMVMNRLSRQNRFVLF